MNLTEGAKRILRKAALLAGAEGRPAAEARDLLRALFEDESQGGEILCGLGFTSETLADQWPAPFVELPETPPVGEPIPLDPELEPVLREAHVRAREFGRHAEVGSEHLLWGLVAAETAISDLMADWGLVQETVSPQVAGAAGIETAPIAVEETLETQPHANSDRADAWRMIDAAANRCSEGLRVIEDVVRFGRNDPFASKLLKEFRHGFNEAIAQLPAGRRLEMRDTPGDVGTSIGTRAEGTRASLTDVMTANFKRAEEALRTLEEASKLFAPELGEFSRAAEGLRYRLYSIEKTVLRLSSGDARLVDARLYLLVTRELCATDAETVIRQSIVNGVDAIQLREKGLSDRAFLDYAQEVRAWTAERGTLLIVNDRADIAALCDADGVHLGQDDANVSEARRIVGPGKLVGVSTHGIEQVRQAILDGADYLGAGPVFPSGTKEFEAGLAGADYLREVAAETTMPWFAIGGIGADNLEGVLETGATRVAVCGAICGSTEPGRAAAELSRRLRSSDDV